MGERLQENKISKQQFYKTDLYKAVKKRKRKLVKQLLKKDPKMWSDMLPLTRVTVEDDFDDLAKYLNKVKVIEKTEFKVDEYDPYVTLVSPNKHVKCNFLCAEYFHLYHVTSDRTQMRRYSYFECYYDRYVLSCIMDLSEITRTSAFQPLDMDKSDWGHAQQQMKLWNKVLPPDIEELPIEDYEFSTEMRKRMIACSRRRTCAYEEIYENSQIFPDINDPQWMVLSYLLKMQILPLLPKRSVPKYYINLVCKNKTDRDMFAEDLKKFLSEYFKTDPLIQGEVILSSLLLNKPITPENNAVKPYVFVPEKTKDVEQLQNIMNAYVMEDGKRKSHPFKAYVPICVSDKQILDSTALNIPIVDIEQIQFNAGQYENMKYSMKAIYDLCRHFGKKKIRYLWENAAKIVEKSAEKACCKNGISEDVWKQLLEYESDRYELALTYAILQQRSLLSINTHEALTNWYLELTKEMIKKQVALDIVIEGLMIEVKREYEQMDDEKPLYTGKVSEEEKRFRDTINGEPLICYHPDYFDEWLSVHASYVKKNELLRRMRERGDLRTKDGTTYLYGVSLRRLTPIPSSTHKTENYYAIKIK